MKDQQLMLGIFANAFQEELSSPDFEERLQTIKGALFKRDFAAAFGDEAGLPVYAARWSPTRALCYASILRDHNGVKGYLLEMLHDMGSNGGKESPSPVQEKSLKVVALGGGAAELVALACLQADPDFESNITAVAKLVDSGPWHETVQRLYTSITTAPPLSKYASAAAKALNKPFVDSEALRLDFQQADVLSLDKNQLTAIVGSGPVLVTLLFTLNELYTAGGIKETTTFLLRLGECLAPGSWLLVVDSPGSYSEAAVGKEKRRYPMQWLLDHTLIGKKEEETEGSTWEKVEGRESVWLRLGGSLRYPIALENMRYQMHVYRIRKLDL
jgi:25S rRNA (uracil2843-N3)-methyltransferase